MSEFILVAVGAFLIGVMLGVGMGNTTVAHDCESLKMFRLGDRVFVCEAKATK